MARSLLPTDVELASLRTIDDVLTWVGLDEAPWLAMSNCLGGVDSMRVFASLPAATPQPAFERARIPATATTAERVLTAVEIIQIGLVWRITRQAYALPDIDPLLPEPSAHATGSTAARAAAPASIRSGSSPTKRVKMSTAVDQLDESEVDLLDGNEVEQAYRNFREAVGADPLVDADPTVEQITAMYTKVLKRFEAPYADFSVLTPFGRRTQKQAKARNFILQQDGTWKTVEIPGPPTFMAWSACWKIYRTVLLMLKHPANATTRTPATPIVTVAALEEYYNRIVELNNEFPEAWHLILQAEDQCRGEQFERFQRELVRAKNEGRLPMNLDFDQNRPWVGVFQFAARCQEYWDRVVIRPAQTFLARGGASKNMSKKDAEDTQYSEATSQLCIDHQVKDNQKQLVADRETKQGFRVFRRIRERKSSQTPHGGRQQEPVRKQANLTTPIRDVQVESFRRIVKDVKSVLHSPRVQLELVQSRVPREGLIVVSTALVPIRIPSARKPVKRAQVEDGARARASDRRRKSLRLWQILQSRRRMHVRICKELKVNSGLMSRR